MFEIVNVKARMVLDSRGNPTVEAVVFTEECNASAIDPSGASTGKHEALELRDKGKAYSGKGVEKAVKNVNKIIRKALKGVSVVEQEKIDNIMIKLDGTKNKSKLGANSILAVSMACARCAAKCLAVPLWIHLANLAGTKPKKMSIPTPYSNVINGGKHASNYLMLQEFMIIPNAKTFKERIRIVAEFYHKLKQVIIKKYGTEAGNVGDEGGFAPDIRTAQEALDLLLETRKALKFNAKVKFAIDIAASEIYDKKNKIYEIAPGVKLDKKSLVEYYQMLYKKYPIISIEDPFAEDDFEGFKLMMKSFEKEIRKKKLQIVGDDLLVTNPDRIKKGYHNNLCNALLLKVNQIGTLTEAIEAANLAKSYKWNIMVSHRSGETEDSFIADLAVALGCGQIKAGAPCRADRTSKYNQLLRIEEEFKKYK
jgi:enolase